MLILILLAIVIIIITSLIIYARWNYGILEGMGIPVVKTHFFLGSTYDVHKKSVGLEDVERSKQYGGIYGVYEGREPQVHINDAEIIKDIWVKDQEYFNVRRNLDFKSPLMNEMPDFIQDYTKWKLIRQLTTAPLTPFKIRQMSFSMDESLKDFVEDLKERVNTNGGKLNTDVKSEMFTLLTDLISRCVFSIKIDNKNDPNNYIAKILKDIIEGGDAINVGLLQPYALSFPFLQRWLPPTFSVKAGDEFVKTFREIIKTRRKSGRTQKDYTETVISWLDQLDTKEFKEANITEISIMCQALVMFFAGQDQISSILAYMFYQASKNPEIQNRILKELDTFLLKHNGLIEYENLDELTYLSACIDESLRFIPVFHRTDRVCTKDWEKDGLHIKKGMVIILNIWGANRNPKYFPNPEKYDPERFMPENKNNLHPYALASFGHDPRNCIGKRLALDIMLLGSANIYKEFIFKCNANSKIGYVQGSLITQLMEPIMLDVSNRKK